MDLSQLLKQTTIESTSESTKDESIEESNESIEESNESLDESLDESTIDPRFQQPWNKLEKGVKLNRILVFVKQESIDKCLSDTLSKELKQTLFNACDRGLFNKITDVTYNSELAIIESFKCLEFNESTRKYKISTNSNKQRSVSKSRSNIDRLVKIK